MILLSGDPLYNKTYSWKYLILSPLSKWIRSNESNTIILKKQWHANLGYIQLREYLRDLENKLHHVCQHLIGRHLYNLVFYLETIGVRGGGAWNLWWASPKVTHFLRASLYVHCTAPSRGLLLDKPLSGHSSPTPNGRKPVSNTTHPVGRGSVWSGNPACWTVPTPYSPRLIITLISICRLLSLCKILTLITLTQILKLGMLKKVPDHPQPRWRSWSGWFGSLRRFSLLAFGRSLAQAKSPPAEWLGWRDHQFELSGLKAPKMIGSMRLFLPRSHGHIQPWSQIERSVRCNRSFFFRPIQIQKCKWNPWALKIFG